jgi:hypothetical protein
MKRLRSLLERAVWSVVLCAFIGYFIWLAASYRANRETYEEHLQWERQHKAAELEFKETTDRLRRESQPNP